MECEGNKHQSNNPGGQHGEPPDRLQDHSHPGQLPLVLPDHPEGLAVGGHTPAQAHHAGYCGYTGPGHVECAPV